jgi:cytochrome o ubiquinol oxidase subunit 2
MKKSYKIFGLVLLSLVVVTTIGFLLRHNTYAVLQPRGVIAQKQRTLIITATLLMLLVVVPVLVMTAGIAYKYRATNTKARYMPNWDHNAIAETIWWTIPLVLVAVLGVITWNSSHDLDPSKPIASTTQPITIQVVAMQWKWLFIYPDQNIATLNYVQFPKNTPVNFQITSDAAMNSFWIPQLGGQIYAMAGMTTQLHLMANQAGKYRGASANLSGAGFAGMKFIAEAAEVSNFKDWVNGVKRSPERLTMDTYTQLATASSNVAPKVYAWEDTNLYSSLITKYMGPDTATMQMKGMTN